MQSTGVAKGKRMAKGIRSKSRRKAQAVKYAAVFKPVEEARTARLAAKLASIPSSERMREVVTGGDAVMPDSATGGEIQPLVRTGGRRRKAVGFNPYGLSLREVKF